MPNKTIYVAEADAELYQRAQELAGGNLSAAISQALRRFVEIREAHMELFDEVEVTIGSDGIYHRKRFIARPIGHWRRTSGGDVEYLVAYQTKKGRYAVHTKRYPVGADQAAPGPDDWQTTNEYWERVTHLEAWGSAEFELAVFEELADLKAAVPPELARLAEANFQHQPVEELDI